MKDRQITAGHRDPYAELGVEHPREAFDRLTGGAFTDQHHERLLSLATLARLLGQYRRMGDLLEAHLPLLDGLQKLHDDLEACSDSEPWRRTCELVQRDRHRGHPVVDMLRLEEVDTIGSFWSNTVLDQLTPDRPDELMSELRQHIQQVQGLMSLFITPDSPRGAPLNLERYVFIMGSDLFVRMGQLPRGLTPRELALYAEHVGLEDLPKVDESDAAGNLQEGRERLANQWKETVSSARGRKDTDLSRRCGEMLEGIVEEAVRLMQPHLDGGFGGPEEEDGH